MCYRKQEVWGGVQSKTLLDARLFPAFTPQGGAVGLEGVSFLLGGCGSLESWQSAWRLSLREVLFFTDQHEEFLWREQLMFSAGQRKAAEALKNHTNLNLLPLMRGAVLQGRHEELLSTLDSGEKVLIVCHTFTVLSSQFYLYSALYNRHRHKAALQRFWCEFLRLDTVM